MAAQPFNTSKRHSAPRDPDERVNEFWLENPFDFERRKGFNLSMYERNRMFLNMDGRSFAEASHVSATDIDADSRAVAVGDLNEDGRPDLIVRSVGGGVLRVYLNQIPARASVRVTLRGRRSNSAGIGARMVMDLGGRKLHRDHFPQNSLMAQTATETIFGLGDYDGPMTLTITWPSGAVQVVENVKPGRHVIEEPDA